MGCLWCDGDGRIQKFLDRTFSNRCPKCSGYGIVPDEAAYCYICGQSLEGQGSCVYEEEGKERTICLLCGQVRALKGEHPFNV